MIRQITLSVFAAAVCTGAATIVSTRETPIDAALPMIVLVMTAVAALTHPAVMLSIPLLFAGEIAIADERQRLLCFGVVIAVAFAAAMLESQGRLSSIALALAAIFLLRWIPFDQVLIGRELFILIVACLIVLALDFTPLGVAAAIAAALFTTAVPLRTLAIPLLVLAVATLAHLLGVSRVRLPMLAAPAVGLMLVFFAWSGALARALPVMLRGGPPRAERLPVNIALPPGSSADIDLPADARTLILSGANVPRLRGGTIVGWIQPGNRAVRIGDIADWGVLRREHYYNSRNPLPARPGGLIRGYGQTAWIDASGRVDVSGRRVTVTADPQLPPRASLQIDAIELAR